MDCSSLTPCPYSTFSFKDTEVSSGSQGSHKVAEEPGEGVSAEEMIQVSDTASPSLRDGDGLGLFVTSNEPLVLGSSLISSTAGRP